MEKEKNAEKGPVVIYNANRRRSSALEAKGFPTSTDASDVDQAALSKKQSVRRIFGYPISIPFIIANEFCERFSYYGMRTILTLYMTHKLMMSKEEATDWYHEFVALCYLTPLIGALIADIYLGRFKTIMILSMVYCTGNAVMAFTAIGKIEIFREGNVTEIVEGDTTYMDYQPALWGPLVGLHLIALGTGGIKPCVSSFGGDQFMSSESDRLQRFFSMFYFSINAGSTVATILTPELRAAACMGESTCYPLAFGVPALFMVVAVVAFVVASRWYIKMPPLGNPLVDVAKVTWAIVSGKQPEQIYGTQQVADVKQLYRVLAVFIPFPFFWALFEQQGSRWVIQAELMNGHITDGFELKPDQMQVFNPLLILVLIPVFEVVVYPIFKKLGLPSSAPFRMITGMVLVALSFVMCGFVQLSMENTFDAYVKKTGNTTLKFEDMDKREQIHILSIIPQIFVITCGEIMCSITALEFAYSYAPISMKSVCQSMFLLTNAFGNVCVIIFTKISDEDLYLYFMWAGIQLAAAVGLFFICKNVQGPLEAYKNAQIEREKGVMKDQGQANGDRRKSSTPYAE